MSSSLSQQNQADNGANTLPDCNKEYGAGVLKDLMFLCLFDIPPHSKEIPVQGQSQLLS
jgi:hypothetical protein